MFYILPYPNWKLGKINITVHALSTNDDVPHRPYSHSSPCWCCSLKVEYRVREFDLFAKLPPRIILPTDPVLDFVIMSVCYAPGSTALDISYPELRCIAPFPLSHTLFCSIVTIVIMLGSAEGDIRGPPSLVVLMAIFCVVAKSS